MSESKIDVVDLVISALKEHEKRLDERIHRLELLLDKLQKNIEDADWLFQEKHKD